jgi:hypothetical protein
MAGFGAPITGGFCAPADTIACAMAAPRRKPIQIEDAGVPAAMKGFPLRKTPWQKARYLLLLAFPPIRRLDEWPITQWKVARNQTDGLIKGDVALFHGFGPSPLVTVYRPASIFEPTSLVSSARHGWPDARKALR